MKAKVVLFVNQKGGSGKTSNIINLSTAAMFDGNKDVVILDCDPQKSAYLWQQEDRDNKVKTFDYVLPYVATPDLNVMPSVLIERLIGRVSQIWIDTAGFMGYEQETAQRYIEDILPYADIIVTPLKASKLDIRSTEQTVKYLDTMLSERMTDNRDIPRVFLRSDIKAGQKGADYLDNLLKPVLEKHPLWKTMDAYIPYSGVFTKALEKGGNAFIPRKIEKITESSLAAYREIAQLVGIKDEKTARESLDDVLKSLPSIRGNARIEKAADEGL